MTIKTLLQPTKGKVAFWVLLTAAVFIGSIQGWVFSDPEVTGIPKPWLYDTVRNWPPLWPLLPFLLLPLVPIHILLMLIINREVNADLYFWVVVVPYLYLLSSIFFELVGWFVDKINRRKL